METRMGGLGVWEYGSMGVWERGRSGGSRSESPILPYSHTPIHKTGRSHGPAADALLPVTSTKTYLEISGDNRIRPRSSPKTPMAKALGGPRPAVWAAGHRPRADHRHATRQRVHHRPEVHHRQRSLLHDARRCHGPVAGTADRPRERTACLHSGLRR